MLKATERDESYVDVGDYGIHVKYNDEHVPDSPATVRIVPVSADAKKITLIGLRDRGLEVNTEHKKVLQMINANFESIGLHCLHLKIVPCRIYWNVRSLYCGYEGLMGRGYTHSIANP